MKQAPLSLLLLAAANAQQTTTPQATPPPTVTAPAEDPLKNLTPEQAEALKKIVAQYEAIIAQMVHTLAYSHDGGFEPATSSLGISASIANRGQGVHRGEYRSIEFQQLTTTLSSTPP